MNRRELPQPVRRCPRQGRVIERAVPVGVDTPEHIERATPSRHLADGGRGSRGNHRTEQQERCRRHTRERPRRRAPPTRPPHDRRARHQRSRQPRGERRDVRGPVGVGEGWYDQSERRPGLQQFEDLRLAVRIAEQREPRRRHQRHSHHAKPNGQPQPDQRARPGRLRPCDAEGDERRQTRQHRHEKASGRARSAPEHVEPCRASHECRDREQQDGGRKPQARLTQPEPDAGDRHEIQRAVEQQAELLVEEQPEESVRDVLGQDVDARVRPVRRFGIERAVEQVERREPGRARERDRRAECEQLRRLLQQAQAEPERKERQEHDEFRVQPGQPRECQAAEHPARRRAPLDRLQQPQRAPRHQQRPWHLGEDRPAVRNEGHGEADAEPGQCCHGPPRQQLRQVEHGQRGERRHQADEGDGTQIAGDGVDRQQQDRQAWRVDRVNLPVLPALHVVGSKVATEERPVVTALMVVLDLQVAVAQQTLGDDEIVRLVAADAVGAHGPQAESHVGRQADRKHRAASERGHAGDDRRHGVEPQTRAHNRHRYEQPLRGPCEHEQQRQAVTHDW